MRRKLVHDDALRLDVLHDVETRNPDVARQRYQIFMKETYEALLTLRGKLPFVSIDASGSLKEVKDRVLAAVKQLRIDED